MKILAIETSCDETSVAVVEDGTTVKSLVVNSQIDLHNAYGGVVPEVAARSHLEVMIPVITQALAEAFGENDKSQISNDKLAQSAKSEQPTPNFQLPTSKYWDDIDAIAVTQGPGLLGALLIGVVTARTLAWSLHKPLYPVQHIMGHVYANWLTQFTNPKLQASNSKEIRNSKLQNPKIPTSNFQPPTSAPKFPVLALIVSGGHSQLMYATSHTDWRVIGRTQDDAVGEAFDKAAKVLGLPYPGGPSIAKAAENGGENKYHLTTPRVDTVDPGLLELRRKFQTSSSKLQIHSKTQSPNTQKDWIPDQAGDDKPGVSYNFSFSGLKTGLLRAVQKDCGKSHDFPSFELSALLNDAQKADFAASFQKTAINYLVTKTKLAFEEFKPKTVIIGGGVAASIPLRKALSKELPIEIQYAPQILCTDNAAMIGARAYYQSKNENPVDPRTLDPKPSWPL